jgi:hypothetical protein
MRKTPLITQGSKRQAAAEPKQRAEYGPSAKHKKGVREVGVLHSSRRRMLNIGPVGMCTANADPSQLPRDLECFDLVFRSRETHQACKH